MNVKLLSAPLLLLVSNCSAHAVGWDRNDFIVTDQSGGKVVVYDHDFTFKGVLDDSLRFAEGLDFDNAGNLVVAGDGRAIGGITHFRTYRRDGVQIASFDRPELWHVFQVDVGPNGNYFVAHDDGPLEISPTGEVLRRFGGPGRFMSVAVVNESILWTGLDRDIPIDPGRRDELMMFDLATGAPIGSRIMDGQHRISSMFYSKNTSTVLIINWYGTPYLSEYDLAGNLVRSFSLPANQFAFGFGLTRGPNDDVFATGDAERKIFRWAPDGTFIRSYDLPHVEGARKIVWAGNSVPEPGALPLIALAAIAVLRAGRRCQY